MKPAIYFAFFAFAVVSCGGNEEPATNPEPVVVPLPYIGQHDFDGTDTIYHSVPPYVLIAHDSSVFTNERVNGKIHVANFFFTSCPAICPGMIEQMKRLQGNTSDIDELVFLSHTIDPERDSLPRLNQYIADRSIDTHNWFFLYGERDYVHSLGMDGYIVNAMEDSLADGGFLHSEHFVLVDREGHIRGLYVGTETEQVDQLEKDIRKLLKEEYAN
jgi:protein SCO1